MCLQDASEELKADHAFVCYKFLEIREEERSFLWFKWKRIRFYSPYQSHYYYTLRKMAKSRLNYLNAWSRGIVEEGLHSFSTDAEAEIEAYNSGAPYHSNIAICEFLIPLGAKYHEGVFWGKKSYASNKLKMINYRILK